MSTSHSKYELIRQYRKSGLSVSQFCDQHDLNRTTFYGWIRKYSQNSGFAEIKPKPMANSQVELCFPNGIKVILPGFDIDQIKVLLSIGQCSA